MPPIAADEDQHRLSAFIAFSLMVPAFAYLPPRSATPSLVTGEEAAADASRACRRRHAGLAPARRARARRAADVYIRHSLITRLHPCSSLRSPHAAGRRDRGMKFSGQSA